MESPAPAAGAIAAPAAADATAVPVVGAVAAAPGSAAGATAVPVIGAVAAVGGSAAGATAAGAGPPAAGATAVPGGGTVVAPAGGATAGGPVQPTQRCGCSWCERTSCAAAPCQVFFGAAPTRAREQSSLLYLLLS